MATRSGPGQGRSDPDLTAITRERYALTNLAYRMLGSLAEAEDAVQEAYARWYAMTPQQQQAIESPGAWLMKVTGRLCLDILGSARLRRERYVGEWLPEPLPDHAEWISQHAGAEPDPADWVTLDESVSMAFLVVLDSMTPAERVAFVLHDVFGYPFADVAEIVGRTPGASRKLASSARQRIRAARPPKRPGAYQAEVVRDFKQAWQAKDINALIRLLDPDVVMTTDGGGVVAAALRPIEGREKLARYAFGVADKVSDVTILERTVNGQPGLVVQQGGATATVLAFAVTAGRITHIWAVRNPEKLRSWPAKGQVPHTDMRPGQWRSSPAPAVVTPPLLHPEARVEVMVSNSAEIDGKSAVVVGGGIGGLTAAVALRQVGWRVTVLERAARFGEIGAGITLLSNGLRCLDAIGLGDAVRGSGMPVLAIGMRTEKGRWLSRIDGDGADLDARMGTTALVLHRAELHKILRDALPAAALLAGVVTTGIHGGADGGPAEVQFRDRDRHSLLRAELVVGADGVHSWVRAQRWPDAPAPVYSGSTTWRAVTTSSSAAVTEMSLSWGQGTEFGVMPLVDGRTYWYAAANAGEGQRNPDELEELRRRFGAWHEPIPAVMAHTQPQAVLRHDIYRLPKIDSYHRGSVVLLGDAAHAMTPNLGQGGGQALEDAIALAAAVSRGSNVATALHQYDHERRARTQAMSLTATRQLRFGQQLHNPVAVAIRNTAVALTPDRVALLAIAKYGKWCPPASRVLRDAQAARASSG